MYVPALTQKRVSKTIQSPEYVKRCSLPLPRHFNSPKTKRPSATNDIIDNVLNKIHLNDFPDDQELPESVDQATGTTHQMVEDTETEEVPDEDRNRHSQQN